MQKILPIVTLVASLNANAVLGPIPIYLNTEYRTDSPVIGSIASTLSFSADDIKATGANTFLDFLATVPSVGSHEGTVPALFMRGSDSDHTLVLVDGVSVHDVSSVNGAVQYGLTNIPLNDIEKIEIIKGGSSVLYGSSAIAGVINITTKKGADGTSATVSTKFGTHNSKTYTLSASSGSKEGFVRFTHNKYSTDGINARDNDAINDKDGISNRSTQIKFGNGHYDITYLEAKNKTEYDRCWTGVETTDDCSGDNKSNKIVINTNKQFSNIWNAKLSLTQTKTNRDTQHGTTLTSGNTYKSTNITLLNDIKINNALLIAGLSQVNDKNTVTKLKHTSKDLFVNWQKNINDLDINAGARYIKHNKFGNYSVYSIGLGKELGNGIRLTTNYNTAFQAPTLFEVNQNKNTTTFTNPPKLNPETSKNINIGLSKSHSWGEVAFSLFKQKVQNVINYVSGTAPTFTNAYYKNAGNFISKGAELSLNAIISGYIFNVDHTYSNNKENDIQSIRAPKNVTSLMVSKRYGKFNPRAQIIRKSSSFSSDRKEWDGYTLLNLSASYTINKNSKVSLGVKNATNKKYTTASDFNGTFNNPDRTIEIGLDYQF